MGGTGGEGGGRGGRGGACGCGGMGGSGGIDGGFSRVTSQGKIVPGSTEPGEVRPPTRFGKMVSPATVKMAVAHASQTEASLSQAHVVLTTFVCQWMTRKTCT